jgi:serine/threonine protein kinase
MDSFDVIRTLGRGAFATVMFVRRKSDGQALVVKKFHRPMDELSAKERQEVAQEIKLQAHLAHENIVRFVDRYVLRLEGWVRQRIRTFHEYLNGLGMCTVVYCVAVCWEGTFLGCPLTRCPVSVVVARGQDPGRGF